MSSSLNSGEGILRVRAPGQLSQSLLGVPVEIRVPGLHFWPIGSPFLGGSRREIYFGTKLPK